MKKLLPSMVAVAALCALAQPVIAGERAGAVSVSPFVGGYTFDGEQHLETAPVYGLRLGYDLTKHVGIEAVADYLATERTRSGKRSANALSYRLDLLYNFLPDGPLVPYVAAGGGGITMGHGSRFENAGVNALGYSDGRNTAVTANAGLGVKYFLTDSVALRGDARQLMVFGEKIRYNWEYTAGLSFLFGGRSVPAAAPVAAPAPAPVVEEKAAAPVALPAPVSTLAVTPVSVKRGEAATLSWTSQNTKECFIEPGIGRVETVGKMTVTPSAATSYSLSCTGPGGTTNSAAQLAVAEPVAPPAPKANVSVAPTSISKGDAAKLSWSSQNASDCTMQPGIGTVQPQGSIEVTPSADTAYTLSCTGEGGTVQSSTNLAVVAPAPPAPAPTPEQLCVSLDINFATGKAQIPAKYRPELKKIADFMKQYPQVKGTIEGHTDNVGSKSLNEKLSQQRAQSVKNYLVKEFGIDPSRLAAKGYGFSKPVADNSTAAGRQKNRRIVANFDCVQK